jgi:hypothetical protein
MSQLVDRHVLLLACSKRGVMGCWRDELTAVSLQQLCGAGPSKAYGWFIAVCSSIVLVDTFVACQLRLNLTECGPTLLLHAAVQCIPAHPVKEQYCYSHRHLRWPDTKADT